MAALREAAQLLGGQSPSVAEYRRLREEAPERNWPTDGSVRNWLGPWNDALAAAGLDALPEPHTHVEEQGPQLTEQETIAAIREAATELQAPIAGLSCAAYIRWVRGPNIRRRSGRRPASQQPFDRLGGWRAAKQKAIGGDPERAGQDITLAGADGHGYRYSDEEIFAAAEEILTRLGPDAGWPTTTEWPRERKAILESERKAGKPLRAFPSVSVVWSRFKSWQDARYAFERARGQSREPEATPAGAGSASAERGQAELEVAKEEQ